MTPREQSEALFGKLAQSYQEHGFKDGFFTLDDVEDADPMNLLKAKGLVKPANLDGTHWVFTAAGKQEALSLLGA
jgi:hypothetical protein